MQTFDLETLVLGHGAHRTRAEGACLMEAVAWAAGEDHSDMPACVSPVLRSFGISLNDRLGAEDRQKLKAFIPELIGTAGDGLDEKRKYIAINWLIRIHTPNMLERAGLPDDAESLRSLAVIVDEETRNMAREATRTAKQSAAAAYAATAVDAAYTDAVDAAYATAYAVDAAYAADVVAAYADAAGCAAYAVDAVGVDAATRQSVIDLYAEMIRIGK